MAYQNWTLKSQTICKEIDGLSHRVPAAEDVLERAERLGVQMRCGVHSGKVANDKPRLAWPDVCITRFVSP